MEENNTNNEKSYSEIKDAVAEKEKSSQINSDDFLDEISSKAKKARLGLGQVVESHLRSLFTEWIICAEWEITAGRLCLNQLAATQEKLLKAELYRVDPFDNMERFDEETMSKEIYEAMLDRQKEDFVSYVIAAFCVLCRSPNFCASIITHNTQLFEIVMKLIKDGIIYAFKPTGE